MSRETYESEKRKYETIWQYKDYRRSAPGERSVNQAIDSLGMRPGDSVIDFGCGTGRPAMRLRERGMNVTGVDFAENCLDQGVDIPFIESCLWNLPQDLQAKFGFCTDVMEHIPTSYVDAVFGEISRTVSDGVFFQIATKPDRMGRLIGRTLHLTVRQSDWWHSKMLDHWGSVDMQAGTSNLTAVCK